MTDGVVPGARRPPLTCPASFLRNRERRVLGTLKPRPITPGDASTALKRALEDVTFVANWLRADHPLAFGACRLSARMAHTALLTLDRVVSDLD